MACRLRQILDPINLNVNKGRCKQFEQRIINNSIYVVVKAELCMTKVLLFAIKIKHEKT